MAHPPHRDPAPELEDIRELGLIERQHRKAARTLGVSRGAMGVFWLVPLAIFVIALVALFFAVR
ncbi:hypothetical protein D8770_15060 [Methylobacterium sp. DB1607]|nr:hypothetical protein [Methylobacterium sp. DB1607]